MSHDPSPTTAEPFRRRAAAVLFDMDGTLVDSLASVERMWSRFAAEFTLDLSSVIAFAHGRQIIDTVARFLPDRSAAEQDAVTRRLMAGELDDVDSVVEITGAADTMRALSGLGIPVALVTSATRELAEARMRHAGVDVPSVVVAAEDVARGKPAPDGYLQAAAALGVPAAECLVFEDAEAGLQAARAAGGAVVVVGDDGSAAAADLPRIPDYSHVTAHAAQDGVEIVFDPTGGNGT